MAALPVNTLAGRAVAARAGGEGAGGEGAAAGNDRGPAAIPRAPAPREEDGAADEPGSSYARGQRAVQDGGGLPELAQDQEDAEE